MQGEENVWHILKITTWVRVDLLHNHKPKTFDLLWVHRAPSSEERGLGMSDVGLVFQLCLPEFVIRYLGSSIADLWMNLLKCSSVTAANWTCPPYEWLLKPRYCSRLPCYHTQVSLYILYILYLKKYFWLLGLLREAQGHSVCSQAALRMWKFVFSSNAWCRGI